ncbi:MAG: NAD(P)-dependent oxidoreductase [Dehalococcoidia bacterium]
MRVLIVGATGVIARNLMPTLLARGDRVAALIRSPDRARSILGPHVDLIEGDLLTIDDEQLLGAMNGCDAVVHLATALGSGLSSEALDATAALRIAGTTKLLRAAAQGSVRRYVQQSIAFAYIDRGEDWIEEDTPIDTEGRIGPVIAEMESLVEESPLEWFILRGGVFVGPDTFQDTTVTRLRGGEERVPGSGEQWTSFIHVADYADAVAAALQSSASRAVLNVTAEPIRYRDYLARLAESLEVAPPRPEPGAPTPRSYRCSNAAASALLGWTPSRPIWPVA